MNSVTPMHANVIERGGNMNEDKLKVIKSYFGDDFEIDLDLVKRYSDYNSIPRIGHRLFFGTDEDEFPRFIGENPDSFFVAVPYCAKPENCPEERDSDKCTPDCEIDCPLKVIHLLTKELGSDFIISETDDDYIQYLIHKKKEIRGDVLYQLSWACLMTIKTFLPLVAGTGTRGIAIKVTGPVCKKSSESAPSSRGKKRKSTILGDISAAASYLKTAIEIKKQMNKMNTELDLTADLQMPTSSAKV